MAKVLIIRVSKQSQESMLLKNKKSRRRSTTLKTIATACVLISTRSRPAKQSRSRQKKKQKTSDPLSRQTKKDQRSMYAYRNLLSPCKNKSLSVSNLTSSVNFRTRSVTLRASESTQLTGLCCWCCEHRWSNHCPQTTQTGNYWPTRTICGCLTASCSTSSATSCWVK